jgi:hypothetical protein
MKDVTTMPTTPMTDTEYEIETDRLLKATRVNLQAIEESRRRTEGVQEKTQAALDDVFRTLERMAASHAE